MARRAGAAARGAGAAGRARARARRQEVQHHHRLPALHQGRAARPAGARHLRGALDGSRRGAFPFTIS